MATKNIPSLTLEGARIALAAAEKRAEEIGTQCIPRIPLPTTLTPTGVPMNIAIVDPTLHLLAFHRMPSAKLTSIDIAINAPKSEPDVSSMYSCNANGSGYLSGVLR